MVETNVAATPSKQLTKFLVRKPGSSLHFSRILTLGNLNIAEQLFAACLRKDAECLASLLYQHHIRTWYRGFCALIRKTEFAGIVFQLAHDPELMENVRAAMRRLSGATNASAPLDPRVSTRLRRLVTRETQKAESLNNQFALILNALAELCDRVVWIKGAALARTLYPRADLRLFSDFDCVVPAEHLNEFVARLREKLEFRTTVSPAFSCQIGCGPTSAVADFLLSPEPSLVQPCPISLVLPLGEGTSMIDVKVNPLCHGIQMHELERFYTNSVNTDVRSSCVRTPSLPDHLNILLVNLAERERFTNWRTIYDIDLVVRAMNNRVGSWSEFVRICSVEGTGLNAWVALSVVIDRLNSAVPSDVLNRLKPGSLNPLMFLLTFTINPDFIWNSNSIVSLCLATIFATDWKRRLQALWSGMLPANQFLQKYYASGTKRASAFCLLIHWCVILLPGGLIRRTFGPMIWPAGSKRYRASAVDAC